MVLEFQGCTMLGDPENHGFFQWLFQENRSLPNRAGSDAEAG